MRKATSLFVGCILATSVTAATTSWADNAEMETYRVSITNLTARQPFAPILAASHRAGMSFFEVGQPPSDELARLAEAGDSNAMAAKLLTLPDVTDAQVTTTGLTRPGKTATVTIKTKRGTDHVSVGAMLGATNDAFFALADVALPKGNQKATYVADAYDAGSETNDELASTVLGLGGEGYSPNDMGEGFVHIHSGIHGVGDMPVQMDWRNPVAEITIERIMK
jgi:hypothetical protein